MDAHERLRGAAGHALLAGLVGAIGGTYITLAVSDIDELTVHDFALLNSRDFDNPMQAIERYLKTIPRVPDKVGLSIAGEVDDSHARMTHLPWAFSRNDIRAATGAQHIVLVNEFDAMALALPHLSKYELTEVGKGTPTKYGTRLAIGAGTGFGASALVWGGEHWTAVSGPSRYMSFSLPHEPEIGRELARDGVLFAESVFSGHGLVALYAALAMQHGRSAPSLSPPEITTIGIAHEDAEATQALEVMAGWLGRFAGDLALAFGARGGVYLGGGLASNFAPLLATPRFRGAFDGEGPRSDYLKDIPLFAIKTGADANMRGAAVALAQSLQASTTPARRSTRA